MFRFIKKMFFVAMTALSFNPVNVNSLECVSMSNHECKMRAKIIDINNNEPTFYPISISANKCSGSCNNINDPYAKLCVPSSITNKVFKLMSSRNQTRRIKWHETYKFKCGLDSSYCNNKQRWNEGKCRFECRE